MGADDPSLAARRMAVAIIRGHLPDPAYKLFLFGSRASGKAHPRSDVDIGIEGPGPVPYETLAAIMAELEEAPTLFTLEVVDFKRMPEQFRVVALAHIRPAP